MSPGYFYSPSQLGSTGANHPPHWGNHKLLFLPQVSNRQKRKEREKEREAIHNLQQGVYFLHAYRYIISFGGVWFGFSLFFALGLVFALYTGYSVGGLVGLGWAGWRKSGVLVIFP